MGRVSVEKNDCLTRKVFVASSFNNSSCETQDLGLEDCTCEKDTSDEQDSFTSSSNSEARQVNESQSGTTLSDVVMKMIGIFSPLTNFLGAFVGLADPTGSDKEKKQKTVGELNGLLKGIEGTITNDKMLSKKLSKESKEALARLEKDVSVLSSREDLQKLDLSTVIAKWRESGDHRHLLEMAEKLRRGECVPFSNKKLRQEFIEGLESFAQALEEALQNPPSEDRNTAVRELKQGANAHVNGLDRVVQRGGEQNLTVDDKKYIKGQFEEASEHAQTVIRDENLSRFIPSTKQGLGDWADEVIDYIREWYLNDVEEEEEEEREKNEKQCEQRCAEIKKYDKACARYQFERKKAEEHKAWMENAKRKMLSFLRLMEFEKNNCTQDQYSKYGAEYDYAKSKYRYHGLGEDYYKSMEDSIEVSLPPAYVCEPENIYSLRLDVSC